MLHSSNIICNYLTFPFFGSSDPENIKKKKYNKLPNVNTSFISFPEKKDFLGEKKVNHFEIEFLV